MDTLELNGFVGWDITNWTVQDFLKKADGKDIVVRMHTYGGSVFEGNRIYNSFAAYKGKKKLVITGLCASMGTIIMSSFDEVEIVDNGFGMIHCPSGVTFGNAINHESTAKQLRSMEKNFKKVYAKRAKCDVDELLDGNDHWMDAEEMLKNGFVDRILDESGVIDLDIDARAECRELFETQKAYLQENYPTRFLAKAEGAAENTTPEKPIIINNHSTQNQSPMKNLIALLVAMNVAISVEATDAQAIDAVKDALKERDQKIKDLQAKLEKQNEDGKKAILDNALASKRINAEQYKKLTATASKLATVEDVAELLEGVAGQANITDLIKTTPQGGAKKGREGWGWDDYQEKDPNALDKMRTEDEESYNALYNDKFGS